MGSSSKPVLVAVVDDDELIRNSIADLLSSAHIESQIFSSGEEFLADGVSQEIFCVITDIRMPRMTGIEFAASLRRESDVPLIFISGEPSPANLDASGGFTFIEKPFGPKVLLDAVHRALKSAVITRR